MKRFVMIVLCLALTFCSAGLFADPSAIVTNPADIRFIELTELAQFLEQDLDIGKGITEVIGKKVIDRKFRKAGIPDPAKEKVYYSMVVREMPVDQLNVAFILKGPVDRRKFLEFSDRRYYRYFSALQKNGIEVKPKIPVNTRISEKATRVYPFAFRNSESLVTSFDDYTIISTVPQGDYSLITEIIAVLNGQTPFSVAQPEKISFMTSFVPSAQEREEIIKFEGEYAGFLAKTRTGFRRIRSPRRYAGEKRMLKLENHMKEAISEVERFSYIVEATAREDGYSYDINMIFKCKNRKAASQLKDMLLAWMASSSAKVLSEQDMVSFKSNRIVSHRDTCAFSVKLGSSADEQYQFASMIMTLMMQDRRFNRMF